MLYRIKEACFLKRLESSVDGGFRVELYNTCKPRDDIRYHLISTIHQYFRNLRKMVDTFSPSSFPSSSVEAFPTSVPDRVAT